MAALEPLGPYQYQTGSCFPLGQISLLLGAFATVHRGDRVCDLGCGGGVLLLLLAGRAENLRLMGVELEAEAAALARNNLERNGLTGQILTGDLSAYRTLLPAGQWDLVISNPPWFAAGTGQSGGPRRGEERCTLDQVCAAAGYVLRNGGRFALAHRPERLTDVMEALRGHGLEPKRLQMVQHSINHPPSAILLEAVRQGRPGLTVVPVHMIQS
ncbi:MAG: methyltransferase [Oscillospiraceae bacterium]|nr:methyltransferase [Oscillospiraceae bacterium]